MVADSEAAVMLSLLCELNAFVSKHLLRLLALFDWRLVPIEKSLASSTRPIAIQEIWTHIHALRGLTACPHIKPSPGLHQLGVGVRGGSEAIGHMLRLTLDAHAECVVVKIDLKNVFNWVERATLIAVVAQYQPQLPPFISWLYDQHSNLWVEAPFPQRS
jgi:hypothetical protein